MPSVQRMGDPNSAGGVILAGIPNVFVNGRPIAAGFLPVSPHPCCGRKGCTIHCGPTTMPLPSRVLVSGLPVVLTGHLDTCMHARMIGSTNVFVGF